MTFDGDLVFGKVCFASCIAQLSNGYEAGGAEGGEDVGFAGFFGQVGNWKVSFVSVVHRSVIWEFYLGEMGGYCDVLEGSANCEEVAGAACVNYGW